MNRTLILALGAVLVAGAAQAGEYRISTAGKSPAQVRASIASAAAEACKSAYDGDPAGVYERPVCEREAYKSGVSRYQRLRSSTPATSARRAPDGDAVVAAR
jgi:hypothetical protein